MYPSIKISTIKNAVRFFAVKLTAEAKKTINLCLELIRFGMRSTLTSFNIDYYEYNGGEKEEQGLAIGGYGLALLSDLFASSNRATTFACSARSAAFDRWSDT